jgi:hypothetical protein
MITICLESSITIVMMLIVQATVALIINYDRNMSIVQVTHSLATIGSLITSSLRLQPLKN